MLLLAQIFIDLSSIQLADIAVSLDRGNFISCLLSLHLRQFDLFFYILRQFVIYLRQLFCTIDLI